MVYQLDICECKFLLLRVFNKNLEHPFLVHAYELLHPMKWTNIYIYIWNNHGISNKYELSDWKYNFCSLVSEFVLIKVNLIIDPKFGIAQPEGLTILIFITWFSMPSTNSMIFLESILHQHINQYKTQIIYFLVVNLNNLKKMH